MDGLRGPVTVIFYFEATEESKKEFEAELDRCDEKTQAIQEKLSLGDFSEDAAKTEVQKVAREFAMFVATKVEIDH